MIAACVTFPWMWCGGLVERGSACHTLTVIEVAGIQVPRAGMIEVAHRLVLGGEIETASRVLQGLVNGKRIELDMSERGAVLRSLDDPPSGLEGLRAVLLQEVVRWTREGLA